MSELHLWRAVIAQALDDATSTRFTRTASLDRRQARAWFKSAGPDFTETCALAGLDPEAVRNHALGLIAKCVDPAIRAQAVLKKNDGKRGPKPRRIELNGLNLTIAEWACRNGLSPHTIHSRLHDGWSIEAALTAPAVKAGHRNPHKHAEAATVPKQ